VAFGRYQIILLGVIEARMNVNNLYGVFTHPRPARESNRPPLGCTSHTYHTRCFATERTTVLALLHVRLHFRISFYIPAARESRNTWGLGPGLQKILR